MSLAEDEYIEGLTSGEELNPSHISQKVGSLSYRGRHQVGRNHFVDTILDVDVLRETKLDIEQDIDKAYEKFASKYNVMPDTGRYKTDVDMSQYEPKEDKKDPSESIDSIINQVNQYRNKIAKKLQENSEYQHTASEQKHARGTTNPTSKNMTQKLAYKQECDMAWSQLQNLKNHFGDDYFLVKDVTLQQILTDRYTRGRLIESISNGAHYFNSNIEQEFKKRYLGEEDYVSYIQDMEMIKEKQLGDPLIKVQEETEQHNEKIYEEYFDSHSETNEIQELMPGPHKINEKVLLKQIKEEIQAIKLYDPDQAQKLTEFYEHKNEFDDAFEMEIDESLIKFYPGSVKGPEPEDDPKAYSKWFVQNQHKEFNDVSKNDMREYGVKNRYIRQTKKKKDIVYYDEFVVDFLTSDKETLLMECQKGMPYFIFHNPEFYNIAFEDVPDIIFSSGIYGNDLSPIYEDIGCNWHVIHEKLERYQVFRMLPQVMEFDRQFGQFFKDLRSNKLIVPKFTETINPPSLYAYYETLPQWARDNQHVKNLVLAFEHHKPRLSIREKECAVNYLVSFLRPYDEDLMGVIEEVTVSTKEQINDELGKEMISELSFYEVDEMLGWTSTEDEGKEGDLSKKNDELMLAMLSLQASGATEEQMNERARELQEGGATQDILLQGKAKKNRKNERSEIQAKEQNLANYTLDDDDANYLNDWPIIENPNNQYCDFPDRGTSLPINYYDNDDGFWNEYIDYKYERMEKAGFGIGHWYYKH